MKEIPFDPTIYKTQWGYVENGVEKFLLLRVDDDSTQEELEDESEYWFDQIRSYDIDDFMKSEVMKAIRWITMLMEAT
jgi:hypothetical protein